MDSDYEARLLLQLENHDRDREELLARFQAVDVPQHELSDLRVELVHRTKELHEAQQKLSDQRVMLQEEREKSARLLSENASHRCQEEDDRSRIAALLRLTKNELESCPNADVPVAMRPTGSSSKRGAATSMSLRHLVRQSPGTPPAPQHDTASLGARIDSALQAPPQSGLVAALRAEVDTLNKRIDEQRYTYETDRAQRLSEERVRYKQQEDSLLKYSKSIDHLQSMLNETTKELCTYRHTMQMQERELRGEIEALRARCIEGEQALEKERTRRTADMKEGLQAAAIRSSDVVDRLRVAARDKENVFERKQQSSNLIIQKLESELNKAGETIKSNKRKATAVERRLHLDAEGLRTDLKLCQQELRAVQKKMYFAFHRGEIDEVDVDEEDGHHEAEPLQQ